MRKPTSNTQKPFSKVEKYINEFKDRIKEILKLNVYDPAFILNIDQTRVTLDSSSKKP